MVDRTLGRGLSLFWGAWFSLVFFSNLADALKQAGALPVGWRYVSGNLGLIRQSIEIYALGVGWAAILFAGVLLAQLATALLFWWSFLDRGAVTRGDDPKARRAYSLAIGLFAAFLLADELFIVYDRLPGLATTHLLVLCALLLSCLSVGPEKQPRRS